MDQFNAELFSELVKVTDATVQLWDGTEVSAAAAHTVFGRACRVFRSLSADDQFKNWLRKTVVGEGDKYAGEATWILEKLDTYLHFLQIEKSVLIEAGMSSSTADVLLHHMTLFRKLTSVSRIIDFYAHGDGLDRELSRLAKHVCEAADEMRQVSARHRRWVAVRSLGLKAGGWTIIGANGASFVAEIIATSGLTLPVGGVSLASTVLGNMLVSVSKGLTDQAEE